MAEEKKLLQTLSTERKNSAIQPGTSGIPAFDMQPTRQPL
jgi:hypothetical protein